jgi:hypothetical protein
VNLHQRFFVAHVEQYQLLLCSSERPAAVFRFIFQKHPDDCPVFLLDGNAYSPTIQSAHQLTEPNVQCFWRLL